MPFISRSALAFVTAVVLIFSATQCYGQGGVGTDTGNANQGFDFGNFGNGGFGNGLDGFQDFGGFQLQNEVEIEPSLRSETGFVGVRTDDVVAQGEDGRSQGFIGPRIESSFGGGNNGQINQNAGTNRQGGAGGGGGAAGFQGIGNSLFFQVQRQGLRTRLSRNFISRTLIQGPIVGPRFVSTLARIPQTRAIPNTYKVTVANKTATISGSVSSQSQADQIVRQLRLEPGVYRINNQLQIRQ